MISKQCEAKFDCFLSNHPNCNLDELYEALNEISHFFESEESCKKDDQESECDLKHILITCSDLLALNLNLKNIIEVCF